LPDYLYSGHSCLTSNNIDTGLPVR